MMRSVVLFTHVIGMVLLFIGVAFEWVSLESLRRATTSEHALSALGPSASTSRTRPARSAMALQQRPVRTKEHPARMRESPPNQLDVKSRVAFDRHGCSQRLVACETDVKDRGLVIDSRNRVEPIPVSGRFTPKV